MTAYPDADWLEFERWLDTLALDRSIEDERE